MLPLLLPLSLAPQAANEKLARTTTWLEEEKARAEALLYRMSGLIACFPGGVCGLFLFWSAALGGATCVSVGGYGRGAQQSCFSANSHVSTVFRGSNTLAQHPPLVSCAACCVQVPPRKTENSSSWRRRQQAHRSQSTSCGSSPPRASLCCRCLRALSPLSHSSLRRSMCLLAAWVQWTSRAAH